MDRRHETFYTEGRFGTPSAIRVAFYRNGTTIVTAEQDKFTAHQIDTALGREFPAYRFNAAGPNGAGYWLAYGEVKA